jgi:hypothetical protein
MGRSFSIKGGFRPKADGNYPWPCKGSPDRTIELFADDVLTKSPDGTWMKHTGLGCFGIVLTDEEVTAIEGSVNLRLL